MSPTQLAFAQMIITLGFDTAVIIWQTIASNPNIDDAIAKLQESKGKTWDDYKKEPQP
jgi:hypothetical protein